MVQNNKILTVSYGTFSCTLEGFDDAFGTMQAIAEYFRDLAAEDRYFGAEPPQPSEEMLAHIAQKEISRRVEAHRGETGIVLRAQDAQDMAPQGIETDGQEPEVAESEASSTLDESAKPAPIQSAPVLPAMAGLTTNIAASSITAGSHSTQADLETAPKAEPLTDTIEEILPEADDTGVDAAVADLLDTNEPVAVEEVADDTPADQVVQASEPDAGFDDVYEDHPDTALSDTFVIDAGVPDEIPSPEVAEADEVSADAVANEDSAAPEPDSIAAKLQRIRAVVSRSTPKSAEQDYSEDEHADALASPAQEVARQIAADSDADDNPAPTDLYAEDDASEDLNTQLDALDAGGDIIEETAQSIAEDEAQRTPEPAKPQARVVKVTREEFDAILAADRAEVAQEAAEESSLSDEDEADLLRELAEVEAEFATEDEDLQSASTTPPLDAPADDDLEEDDIASIFAEHEEDASERGAQDYTEEQAILSEDVDAEDSIGRLMQEAGSKLETEETGDRRSEFAHLRAAMAAGKAEEAAGGSMSETASDDTYREDLARVVRPRRPDAGDTRERSRRPQDEKPAPLKLVAAQRVDAELTPVQPRRVMSVPIEDMSEDLSDGRMKFADYAAGVGAIELPDLLEAAAAYLSFVEGQEQFSRPQLMTKVRMVEREEFSREDGLRSFGLLLRDGKIEKTQAGRFTVSDRIGFRPEDMRAAG